MPCAFIDTYVAASGGRADLIGDERLTTDAVGRTTITVPARKGWEYLWVAYKEIKDSNGLITTVPYQATVEQVPDRDGEVLRYLSMLGLVPGQDVELRDAAPFGGPLTIRTSGGETAISRELAAQIRVST